MMLNNYDRKRRDLFFLYLAMFTRT